MFNILHVLVCHSMSQECRCHTRALKMSSKSVREVFLYSTLRRKDSGHLKMFLARISCVLTDLFKVNNKKVCTMSQKGLASRGP